VVVSGGQTFHPVIVDATQLSVPLPPTTVSFHQPNTPTSTAASVASMSQDKMLAKNGKLIYTISEQELEIGFIGPLLTRWHNKVQVNYI